MRVKQEDLLNLDCKGIYCIKNIINNKVYIGSTYVCFLKRFKKHFYNFQKNNHPNEYLKSSIYKYGIENFEFQILEVIIDKHLLLNREKYWIDFYKSSDNKYGYNINSNPNLSPMLNINSRKKVSETIKKLYKDGIIKPNSTTFKKGSIPWNKNKKYKSTDHLKVPKTITDKFINARKKISMNLRDNSSKIAVYDLYNNLLGIWNSSKDLEEWSLTDENKLPIKSRFKKERMGKPVNFLQSCNINRSCKTNKAYKGLFFNYYDERTLNSVNSEKAYM